MWGYREQDKTPLRTKQPSDQNPPPAKNPFGQNPTPAKIPLRQKASSSKKKKNILSTPLLSSISKYLLKLRLFYIKFRLGGQWHFVLTITITCQFSVITCNLTRSPGGEFLSAVVFGRRGIFVGEGFWPEGGFLLAGVFFFLLKSGFSQRGVLA